MNKEERDKVHVVTSRLIGDWLKLREVIATLPEGEDTDHLIKGKSKIEDGLSTILLSLEVR